MDGDSDIDLVWQLWYDLFISAVDRHVPKRKIRGGHPPWIDGEVMHLLRQKSQPEGKHYRVVRTPTVRAGRSFVVLAVWSSQPSGRNRIYIKSL